MLYTSNIFENTPVAASYSATNTSVFLFINVRFKNFTSKFYYLTF